MLGILVIELAGFSHKSHAPEIGRVLHLPLQVAQLTPAEEDLKDYIVGRNAVDMVSRSAQRGKPKLLQRFIPHCRLCDLYWQYRAWHETMYGLVDAKAPSSFGTFRMCWVKKWRYAIRPRQPSEHGVHRGHALSLSASCGATLSSLPHALLQVRPCLQRIDMLQTSKMFMFFLSN